MRKKPEQTYYAHIFNKAFPLTIDSLWKLTREFRLQGVSTKGKIFRQLIKECGGKVTKSKRKGSAK